jgi:hypothetical protein
MNVTTVVRVTALLTLLAGMSVAVAEYAVVAKSDTSGPSCSSIGGGAFFASDFGGGLRYGNGEQVRMPYYGGGAYLFIDATYLEIFAGYSAGGGMWKSADAHKSDSIPNETRSHVNIGIFAKYPFEKWNVKIFPLLGIDYEAYISGERVYDWGEVKTKESKSALWFKAGGGADVGLSERAYLRLELLYGVRTANEFENVWKSKEAEFTGFTVKTKLGHGVSARVGAGVRF